MTYKTRVIQPVDRKIVLEIIQQLAVEAQEKMLCMIPQEPGGIYAMMALAKAASEARERP